MGASKLSDLTSAGVRVTALGCCLLLVSVLPTIHSSAHQLHSHPAPNKSNYSSRNSISPSEVRHHALPAFNSLARPVIRLQGLRPRRPPDSQNLSGTASNPIDRRQFVSTGAKFLSIMGWWCSGVKRLVAQGPGVEDEEAEEQDPVLTSSCGKICMEKCFSSFGQALVPGNRADVEVYCRSEFHNSILNLGSLPTPVITTTRTTTLVPTTMDRPTEL
mmetsp:Transcript_18857/g.29488  ORF Transcript_18857/g.29488 Transcript_18857/m.29488 type:complete len:217 (-) Transcript_18857:384-1034(-)